MEVVSNCYTPTVMSNGAGGTETFTVAKKYTSTILNINPFISSIIASCGTSIDVKTNSMTVNLNDISFSMTSNGCAVTQICLTFLLFYPLRAQQYLVIYQVIPFFFK
jgi:hypothetical protein